MIMKWGNSSERKEITLTPFALIMICWGLVTLLLLIYLVLVYYADIQAEWLWIPIGILITIGILVYEFVEGSKYFWIYNKKINGGDEGEKKTLPGASDEEDSEENL
jgi:glucan phosphoethanolaminetransferase (alkaline phosphatase superfamily)